MRYEDLSTGHFFRITVRPDLGKFFKCQPWVSTTADLEKMIQFKPDVDVSIADNEHSDGGQGPAQVSLNEKDT